MYASDLTVGTVLKGVGTVVALSFPTNAPIVVIDLDPATANPRYLIAGGAAGLTASLGAQFEVPPVYGPERG